MVTIPPSDSEPYPNNQANMVLNTPGMLVLITPACTSAIFLILSHCYHSLGGVQLMKLTVGFVVQRCQFTSIFFPSYTLAEEI